MKMTNLVPLVGLLAIGVLAASAVADDPQPPKPSENPPSSAAKEKDKPAPQNAPAASPKNEAADQAKDKADKEKQDADAADRPKDAADQPPALPPQAADANRKDAPRPAADHQQDRRSAGDRGAAPGAQQRRQDQRDDARDDRRDDRDDRQLERRDARTDRAGEPGRHQVNRPSSNDDRALRRDDRQQARSADRVRSNIGLDLRAGGDNSLLINSVPQGGFFGTVGFHAGDQIVSAGGQRFANQAAFYTWLGTAAVGQRVPIVVLRNGQQVTVYWTPTEEFVREYRDQSHAAGSGSFFGMQLDEQIHNAAVVLDVEPNSPAHRAGVRPNDMIVGLNDQEIASLDDFYDAVERTPEGTAVGIDVSRNLHMRLAQDNRVAPVDQQRTDLQQERPPSVITTQPVAPPAAPARPASPPPRRGPFRNR